MSFADGDFFFLLPIVWLCWWWARHAPHWRSAIMLSGSLFFYGFHERWLLGLLLTYCLVNWLIGRLLEAGSWRRTLLTLGIAFNLGVLAFWKYTPLVIKTLAGFDATWMTSAWQSTLEKWAIPFGISFYAFTGIAYMVDVFRRETPAESSFWRYTLSAAFFPHLVAGPILRPHEFLTRLTPSELPNRVENPLEALQLLASGYFKKMVLADRMAIAIDPFFAHLGDPATAGVWSLPYVYLYALQIYFDFSGYTDIARGLGLLFGFRWPANFDLPYLASSIQDFWRRWHMTLSRFLRDYLYIPLGGSRHGTLRTLLNLFLTMLLGGLWHGAHWTFLLWGGLHGVFLIVNVLWRKTVLSEWLQRHGGVVWRVFSTALTFHAVCLAWCFFRLTDLNQSLTCVRQWWSVDPGKWWGGAIDDASLWVLLLTSGLVTLLLRFQPAFRRPIPDDFRLGLQLGTAVALLLLAALLSPSGDKPPFIYFQF